jgi:signal transduction histidine kinase
VGHPRRSSIPGIVSAANARALRVLVVDDVDADAMLTVERLRAAWSSACAVDRAHTAEQARAALTEGGHDLCLLDVHLGDDSGLVALRAAREAGSDVPVIVLTSARSHDVDVAAAEAGADEYLDKVRLTPELLERAIRYARMHRRQLRELRVRNEELARLDREKNLLLGTAAHDLRNPIGVVLGNAEFLRGELGTIERSEMDEMLERIERSCRNMLGLIDDLLDLSSIAAGTLELRTRLADARSLASEVVAEYGVLAQKKGIRLTLEAPAPVPVAFDHARMAQVLGNLVGNAIKYSKGGTDVHVFVEHDPHEVRFVVVDQGIGIAPELLPRLFKPFTKGQGTGTGGEKSTGLGLAIVHRIVEAHGGRIAVASELGVGSTFTVTIPRDATPAQDAPSEHAPR